MLTSSLPRAFFRSRHLLGFTHRYLSLLVLLLLLASLSGCTTRSTFTVYDLSGNLLTSLRKDVALCRAAGARIHPDRTLYWLLMATLYDMEHNSNAAVNNCLLARGWRPRLQFTGPFGAGPGDLEAVFKKCGAQGGYAGLLAKAEFSGMVAEHVVTLGAGPGGAGTTELGQCIASAGWHILDRPPWFYPDDASSSYVVDPVAENIAEKFIAEKGVVKDMGKSIFWLQDNPEDGKSLDWYHARHYVIGLNRIQFNGYSDWRIPRRDEVESLLDYARWNAAIDLAALLKKLGFNGVEGAVYWTSSPMGDGSGKDGIWGVDFKNREYIGLGSSELFTANVLPVRGRGWGGHQPELALHEPSDKEEEGERIAARYHRYKAGNCTLPNQSP